MHVQVRNECCPPADICSIMQVIDVADVCLEFVVPSKIKKLKCSQTFWQT